MAQSENQLTTTAPGRSICIAYVFPNGTGTSATRRRMNTTTETATYSNAGCFTDALPNTEQRIQITVQRTTTIDIIFRRFTATLSRQIAIHYEVVG
jgi:ABC-type tungstate transport system permease subunit